MIRYGICERQRCLRLTLPSQMARGPWSSSWQPEFGWICSHQQQRQYVSTIAWAAEGRTHEPPLNTVQLREGSPRAISEGIKVSDCTLQVGPRGTQSPARRPHQDVEEAAVRHGELHDGRQLGRRHEERELCGREGGLATRLFQRRRVVSVSDPSVPDGRMAAGGHSWGLVAHTGTLWRTPDTYINTHSRSLIWPLSSRSTLYPSTAT
jgi:hypothetical protein